VGWRVYFTVSYQGGMGTAKTITLNVNSTYFPLTKDLFNPSIYGTETFNETTHPLVTGQYGFGGWTYSAGIDLSGFKYLVVKLSSATSSGAVLRVFDENSYWTNPAEASFGSSKQAVINISTATKTNTTTKITSSQIYIVGIWSMGGSPIVISDAYVTNNTDYSKPTAVENVAYEYNEYEPVDVYTIMGVRIRSKVLR
jgi:hypothetical protein